MQQTEDPSTIRHKRHAYKSTKLNFPPQHPVVRQQQTQQKESSKTYTYQQPTHNNKYDTTNDTNDTPRTRQTITKLNDNTHATLCFVNYYNAIIKKRKQGKPEQTPQISCQQPSKTSQRKSSSQTTT